MSIASIEMSRLSVLVTSLFVVSRDSASATWCLIPAQFTTLKTNSACLKCHRASRPVESTKMRIFLKALCSIRMVN